ncbi:hypothetical protein [Nocardia sp. NPDC052566]|uniref:hypothetical protein n=1 Tax=Nocardia sp. NPDC052566 TaxID=3364330 RepID=UPI0037C95EBC
MRTGLKQLRDEQFGAFTARQALVAYSPAEMRARIDRGEWIRVFYGVYRAVESFPSPEMRVEAARLSTGAACMPACYETAAELHGFSVLVDAVTHVLGIQKRRPGGLVVHQDRVALEELVLVRETLATSPARTAVDLARTLKRMDAMATLDAAVRQGVSPDELAVELLRCRGRRGRRQAIELIPLADGRAESPMESRARLRCIDAGLPAPEPQLEVDTPDGRRRIDLGWRAWRIGLEYDSTSWHSGEEAATRDRTRHNWLTAQGWTLLHTTATDVYHHPEHFTEPIRRALRRHPDAVVR